MPIKTLTTTACALALGFAWSAAPAIAQESTKAKAERKADQIEQKGEQKADKIENKAEKKAHETRVEAQQKADQVRDKAEGKSDTADNKMERAWDKTKAKTRDMKDSVTGNGRHNGRAATDVRSAQQALRDKGFDPGPIDGVMGPRTSAAVRDFQQKENLRVTGQLDAETRSQLLASSSPAASPSSPRPADSSRQSR